MVGSKKGATCIREGLVSWGWRILNKRESYLCCLHLIESIRKETAWFVQHVLDMKAKHLAIQFVLCLWIKSSRMPEGSKSSGFSQLVVILRQNKVFLSCWEWERTQSFGGSGGLVFQDYSNQKPAFRPQRLMDASLPWVSCGLNTNPDIVFERERTWIVCVLVYCEQAAPGLTGRRALSQHPQCHHSRCECLSLCSQQCYQGRRGFVFYIILSITWKRDSQTHCVRACSMSFRQLQCISTASAHSSCRQTQSSEAHIREAHWLLDGVPSSTCRMHRIPCCLPQTPIENSCTAAVICIGLCILLELAAKKLGPIAAIL